MLTLRRLGPRGHGPPTRHGARLALIVLALAALGIEGCSSWRGSRCGTGCGLFQNNRLSRMFRRDVIVTDPCSEPGLVLPAAPMLAPGPAVIQSPAPLVPVEPGALEPIAPPSESAAPKSSQASATQRTLYETEGPARGTISSRREGLSSASSNRSDPLINLPPLSAVPQPAEDVTPPVPPAAAPVELPPNPTAKPLSLTQGIARFKVVRPQIAGGSAPSDMGWSFLLEKGYRTVLDLRPTAEAKPNDVAAAHRAGLRYVLMPVTTETLDDGLMRRFSEELSQADNKPLFFFDNDGGRAAVLWYLHLVIEAKLDEPAAAREVSELGPREGALWLAATAYLESREAPRDQAPSVTTPAEVAPAEAPADTGPPPIVPPTALVPASASLSAPMFAPPAEYGDPTAWRPLAAMILTGLTVPLALLGRSAISRVTHRRASLPAPKPGPRSLPRA